LPAELSTIVASVPTASPADGYHGQPIRASKSSAAPGRDYQPNPFLKAAYAYGSIDQFYKQASPIFIHAYSFWSSFTILNVSRAQHLKLPA
jgi:hypothetical protein